LNTPSANAVNGACVSADCHDGTKLSQGMSDLRLEPDLPPARIGFDRTAKVDSRFIILERPPHDVAKSVRWKRPGTMESGNVRARARPTIKKSMPAAIGVKVANKPKNSHVRHDGL
jgi:hypothetical protein